MDINFVFPRPQPAVARPQKPVTTSAARTKPGPTISRGSNALRASVLDAALELGIGTNPMVADWMFNNALKEEDEEEDQITSPSLTYGSSATSEESAFSVLSPSSSTHSSSSPALGGGGGGAGVATKFGQLKSDGIIQILDSSSGGISSRSNNDFPSTSGNVNGSKGTNTVSFPESQTPIPIPPRPTTPRKLKKKIKGDGYESDGGYVSEAGAKKKEKERKKAETKEKEREKAELKAKEKEKKVRDASGQEKPGEDERKRKKSLLSAVKATKSSKDKDKEKDKDAEAPRGYETDGGTSKSKSKSKKSKSTKTAPAGDVGYETDAGYQSSASVGGAKKSKSRFFRLGGSKDKDGSGAGGVESPPVPALPADILKEALSLPIAERFATTFGSSPGGSLLPTSTGKAESPISATPTPPLQPLGSSPGIPVPLGAGVFPAAAISSARLAAATADRNSQASTESSHSSSTSSRRRAGQFSPTPSSSAHDHGHGVNGSGTSYSTLTSSHSHPHQQHQQNTQAASRPTSPTGTINPSPSISISMSQSQDDQRGPSLSTNMKPSHSHPPISYPLARLPSPSPAPTPSMSNNIASSSPTSPVSPSSVPSPLTSTAPLQINKEKGGLRLKPSSEKLGFPGFRSRGPSPVPVSPVSPGGSSSPLISPTGARPQAQAQTASLNSGLSPHSFISAPNTAAASPSVSNTNTPYPSPFALSNSKFQQQQQQQRPNQLTLVPPPSDGASFPSRSPSPSRPNVLAYYDIPPPSPPPMGPLPTVPGAAPPRSTTTNSTSNPNSNPPSNSYSTPFPPASILRQRVIDRTPRPIPPDAVPYQHVAVLQNIQRGKESPFPARPVLPPGSVPRRYVPMTQQQLMQDKGNVKRARFASGEPTNIDSMWMDDEDTYSYAEDGEGDVIGYEVEEEEESQEIRGVLDRFDDERRRSEDDDTQALERSHSFEALKKLTATHGNQTSTSSDDHVTAAYQPTFAFTRPLKPKAAVEEEYDGLTIGNRTSRWSGSIYSRNSVLDEDESGSGRERLVRRVEEMLLEGETHEEKRKHVDEYVPPVPKLPAAYANGGNWTASGMRSANSNSNQDVVVTSPAGRSWNRF